MRLYQKRLAIVLTVLLIVGLTSSGVFADNEPHNQNAPPSRTVADFSGSGTAEDPYRIGTAEDLAVLANEVNNGNSFKNFYFLVTDRLDFKEMKWTPIGTLENPFQGNFNGDQKLISNLNYAGKEICAGLFGCIANATVKDIAIDNNCTFKNANHNGKFGAVVGYAQQSSVNNCVNNAYVTGLSDNGGDTEGVGGIVGVSFATKIDGCINHGMVSGFIAVGGIVGNGQAIRCINYGRVSGASTSGYLGGIAGKSMGTAAYNCVNNGPISGGTRMGGIVGGAYDDTVNLTIEDCINNGSVTSLKPPGALNRQIGGILGQTEPYPILCDFDQDQFNFNGNYTKESLDLLIDCSNYGKVNDPLSNQANGLNGMESEAPCVANYNYYQNENINLRNRESKVEGNKLDTKSDKNINNTYNNNQEDSLIRDDKEKFSKSYAFTKPS